MNDEVKTTSDEKKLVQLVCWYYSLKGHILAIQVVTRHCLVPVASTHCAEHHLANGEESSDSLANATPQSLPSIFTRGQRCRCLRKHPGLLIFFPWLFTFRTLGTEHICLRRRSRAQMKTWKNFWRWILASFIPAFCTINRFLFLRTRLDNKTDACFTVTWRIWCLAVKEILGFLSNAQKPCIRRSPCLWRW